MSTELSQSNEQFIHEAIARGQFRDRSEVLDRAVELLKRRERLIGEVQAGLAQLNLGEYTEYDEQSLDRFLHDVRAEAERLAPEDAAS